MKPVFHPALVNGPCGDPAVYVDFLFEKRAVLFDLGDICALPVRKILRLSDVFVSHAHMDHFFGFDWLLRLCLGRDLRIRLFGPVGFLAQVEHKLSAYTWNLVGNYATDFSLEVTEVLTETLGRRASFRCRTAFRREAETEFPIENRRLLDELNLAVEFAVLDHATPCLAFALREKRHLNVWKNRLAERGLEPGAWVRDLKHALLTGQHEDTPIRAVRRDGGCLGEADYRLGELARSIVHVSAGQKAAYVTDAVYHEANAGRIVALASGADQCFIEAVFGDELKERAARKYHLTARQAGTIARRAGVKFPTPFHFSPVYQGREFELEREFWQAFHTAEPVADSKFT
ncbi:ribonuclease Z [Methylococcus mesophilus]|uniref:ribonuclease Z n=1 Tax=Methylococcus mesophilus TaxID=2993564 RepID=UPI00224AB42F|nr:ribonuclease Z [Methylococcus mesophilus]UZR27959.1 ribonuclease Z [Methylococcus mesophilus]